MSIYLRVCVVVWCVCRFIQVSATDNAPPDSGSGEMAVGKRALVDPEKFSLVQQILFVVWVCVGSDNASSAGCDWFRFWLGVRVLCENSIVCQ